MPEPQVLLIDADDTLWENNIYFEQAIADFMSFLNHQEMTPAEVRLVINEAERETILERGYGSHNPPGAADERLPLGWAHAWRGR